MGPVHNAHHTGRAIKEERGRGPEVLLKGGGTVRQQLLPCTGGACTARYLIDPLKGLNLGDQRQPTERRSLSKYTESRL